MKSILDPTFRYVPSAQTDIRRTFARVRRQMNSTAAVGAPRAAPARDAVESCRNDMAAPDSVTGTPEPTVLGMEVTYLETAE